jgi:hypothetical protein
VDAEGFAVLRAFGGGWVYAFINSFNKAAPRRLKHFEIIIDLIFKF